jgi:hypothetical protein
MIDLDLRKLPNAIVLPSYPLLERLLAASAAWQQDWTHEERRPCSSSRQKRPGSNAAVRARYATYVGNAPISICSSRRAR